MVEPTVNGRSTSVLCSISSQCVIARLDMCSVEITEKWLRLWQRETALTDWPWCSSTNDMSASFASTLSPFESQPRSNTWRHDRATEKDGEWVDEALWAGNYLVILQLLGRALTNWFNNSMQIFTSFNPEKLLGLLDYADYTWEASLLLYSHWISFILDFCCAIAFDSMPTWIHLNTFRA